METVVFNRSLSETEKKKRVQEAKGGDWYEGWRPYCVKCDFRERMRSEDYGFCCPKCGNMIGFNLTRLQESPLNERRK